MRFNDNGLGFKIPFHSFDRVPHESHLIFSARIFVVPLEDE